MVASGSACVSGGNVGFRRISFLECCATSVGLKLARRKSVDANSVHHGDGHLSPISRRTILQRLALDRAPTTLARISDRVIVMQPLAHLAHRPRVPGANNSHSDRSHSGFRTTLLRY